MIPVKQKAVALIVGATSATLIRISTIQIPVSSSIVDIRRNSRGGKLRPNSFKERLVSVEFSSIVFDSFVFQTSRGRRRLRILL